MVTAVFHNDIRDVKVDTSSHWGRYFLAETGFPVVVIRGLVRSRERTDYVSFVGANRPVEWFQQAGFRDIQEEQSAHVTLSGTGFISKEARFSRIMCMGHPEAPGIDFYYVPDIGVLIYGE